MSLDTGEKYYSMSKLSWPKKNLNNFRMEAAMHWGFAPLESLSEAVKNIPSVYSKTGEKVLFQNSIQKSMGIEKTTGCPLKTARF